jgi:hypothetical protein
MTDSVADVNQWWAREIRRLDRAEAVEVDLFVRSLAPAFGVRRYQRQVYERLRALERDGVLAAVSLHVWGEAACTEGPLAETTACKRVRSRVDRFQDWAAAHDVRVELPFSERTVESRVIDETYCDLVLPELCAAVRVDDTLALVVPCHVDGHPIGVEDVLAVLEGVEPTALDPLPERR